MSYKHQLELGNKIGTWILNVKEHGKVINQMYEEATTMYLTLKEVMSKRADVMTDFERRWMLIFYTRKRAANFYQRLR